MAAEFESLEGRPRPEWFAGCDPPGKPLGSGGGAANVLVQAWADSGQDKPFFDWLKQTRKLILHSGGQCRRLPAYAATGKALIPMPVFRWSRGQRLDQSLLDLQIGGYHRVLAHAPAGTSVMVASGDTLLHFGRELPVFPSVDVLGLGIWIPPEKAKDFGVFVCSRHAPGQVLCFLQKPSATKILELAQTAECFVDTGVWLLSQRALRVLLTRCGWDMERGEFPGGVPAPYELYSEFGLSLGSMPAAGDAAINQLTCAVARLPRGEFYHFGTSAQLLESVAAVQNRVPEIESGAIGARYRADQVTQNSRIDVALRRDENHPLWVENSFLSVGWQLASKHVLTGVPENNWSLSLPAGVCLDFAPIDENEFCLRAYGFDDVFAGQLSEAAWFGRRAVEWFRSRELTPEACGLDPAADIQTSALFPVLEREQMNSALIEWLVAPEPLASNASFARIWREARRLSARQVSAEINLRRLYEQRNRFRNACLRSMMERFPSSIFSRLDLEAAATAFARTGESIPELEFNHTDPLMYSVRYQMFQAAVARRRNQPVWQRCEAEAFAELRNGVVRQTQLSGAAPRLNVKEDQIVWARSPVRVDLAGGWTDTPPYCLEHGGKVVNLGVDLNGQPPIQVFAKICQRPEVVLRSIDLGLEEHVRTFQELEQFAEPDLPFALPKAGLALAGFLPRFRSERAFPSLEAQLRDFGGGIELSLLAAVPKGSGLGTSSILAVTVLAALGELCGLDWGRDSLFARTIALEQMLTTGGGWQDQAGALYRGIKRIETAPGLAQKPVLHWLPQHLFGRECANRLILLYYTGVTRLAKNILAEIVRGIFLNSAPCLEVLEDIDANAELASSAIQQCDYAMLGSTVARSWSLNQRLDRGTNPPAIQRILEAIGDYLCAAKLLGAGGGGYLLLLAKDEEAAARIRKILAEQPPNPRARFVDFALSETGLQVTRS